MKKNQILIPYRDIYDFKYFYHVIDYEFLIKQIPWEKRAPIAFFRGKVTNYNHSLIKDNPRINLAYLSEKYPDFIDAKINVRCDKDYIEESDCPELYKTNKNLFE